MLDLNSMFEHLAKNKKNNDPFIESRTKFINQLIEQRGVNITYQLIEPKKNLASKLLNS